MILSVTCIISFCFIFFLIPTSFTTHLPALAGERGSSPRDVITDFRFVNRWRCARSGA